MIDNESVNKLVIRLHKEVEEASRTLGKVRRYGQKDAKARLVSVTRGRLESIVRELKTLEVEYGQVKDEGNNSTTHSNSGRGEGETTVVEGGPGLEEGGPSEVGGPTDSSITDAE